MTFAYQDGITTQNYNPWPTPTNAIVSSSVQSVERYTSDLWSFNTSTRAIFNFFSSSSKLTWQLSNQQTYHSLSKTIISLANF